MQLISTLQFLKTQVPKNFKKQYTAVWPTGNSFKTCVDSREILIWKSAKLFLKKTPKNQSKTIMAIVQQTMTLHGPSSSTSNNMLQLSSKASSFINSAKLSGKCTPSLLPTDVELAADQSFFAVVSNLVDSSHGAFFCFLRGRALCFNS